MSYNEFTFQSLRDQLALHLRQDASLFAHVEEVVVSEYLQNNVAGKRRFSIEYQY